MLFMDIIKNNFNIIIVLILLIILVLLLCRPDKIFNEYFVETPIKKKRVALCMRGAVSKTEKPFEKMNELYDDNTKYVDYKACYNSIKKHIIEPNLNEYQFDIFCHCWNLDLEQDIVNLYSPVKYLFEDNKIYNDYINKLCVSDRDFGGISQALTIKKSIELKEQYEAEHNFKYDIVISYRYDMFLWKDIILNNYTELKNDAIYVNAYSEHFGHGTGDFHFIMNSDVSGLFKNLIDSINEGNKHVLHLWIKNYIINYIKKPLLMDDIEPGIHQEVLRKIHTYSLSKGHLTEEQFKSYS